MIIFDVRSLMQSKFDNALESQQRNVAEIVEEGHEGNEPHTGGGD